jgi:UDP-N-acetylmuramate--alanine ligase
VLVHFRLTPKDAGVFQRFRENQSQTAKPVRQMEHGLRLPAKPYIWSIICGDFMIEGLPERIHFSGIGGAGMSGLASVLHEAGHCITGSDRDDHPVVQQLREEGIAIRIGQQELPESPELLVRTAAMPETHPEIAAALKRGIPVMKRAELLARICDTPVSVAIAGTHGKTSITAMLAKLLERCVPGAGWFIGGQLKYLPSARLGDGSLRICEADEFDRSFQRLNPSHILLGAVDWDHVDCYPSREDMFEAFDRLVAARRGPAPLIMQAGVSALGEGAAYLPREVREGKLKAIVIGEGPEADLRLRVRGGDGNCFDLVPRENWPGDNNRRPLSIRIGLPGAHNRLNAATALAWLLLGEWGGNVSREDAAAAICDFQGLSRRFELLASSGRRRLYDDYGHHPSEIAAFIRGLREVAAGPITVIHQPHTFSRVKAFARETGQALSLADRVILWPVFPAREEPLPGVTHRSILPFVESGKGYAVDTQKELIELLSGRLHDDEVIATVGAGDLYHTHKILTDLLAS